MRLDAMVEVLGHQPESFFPGLDHALSIAIGTCPEDLTSDELRQAIESLYAHRHCVDAFMAGLAAKDDHRSQQQDDSRDPAGSTALWLRERLHLTSSAAYAQVRTSRTLEELPATRRAFSCGAVGAQQVSVICRAMEELRGRACERELQDSVEQQLIEAGQEMAPDELLRFWKQLRYQLDQDAGVAAEQAQHERRWLRLQQMPSGSYRIQGELDPEGGTTLKTALKGLLRPPTQDDKRSAEQRRADALVELARRRLDAGDLPTRGGEKPHLLVVADIETLQLKPGSRMAELDWGVDITGESARRIACDAILTPIIRNRNGDVLRVGCASRIPSPRMRKAINLHYRHCLTPGCTRPAEECETHHIDADGPTILENIALYCPFHHRLIHPENHRFYRKAPAPPTFTSGSSDQDVIPDLNEGRPVDHPPPPPLA
jgi:hypothetical protein